MPYNNLFHALGIESNSDIQAFAQKSGVSLSKLKYYNDKCLFPSYGDLDKILQTAGINELELRLRLGIFTDAMLLAIRKYSDEIAKLIEGRSPKLNFKEEHHIDFTTRLGTLYQGDCLSLMDKMEKESIDLIFADPPFNLNKTYESQMNDNISDKEYLDWTETWVLKCVDLLKEGGSIFIWNLPKWNTFIADILNRHLTFRHWIAVDIKYRLPIKNKLYPSHYSLLYYTKGEKPNCFNEQRLPLQICRHCGGDIHDYGGYKDKLNVNGINLSDIWYDIPPVRHSKYKNRNGNELSMKLLDRIISMTSNEGDLVFDPFGGSGTTYIVSELLNRRWIGIEIGPTDAIKQRFVDIDSQREQLYVIQEKKNILFTPEMERLRTRNGHWLPHTLNKKHTPEPEVSYLQGELFSVVGGEG